MIFLRSLFVLLLIGGMSTSSMAQDLDVYISDAGRFQQGPYQILKSDGTGSNVEVFIDEELAWPQDILFLEEYITVLVSNLSSGKITRHDIKTGAYVDDFATGIGGPTRMKIGPDGLLYVLQWTGNGKVLRYELNGTFVDEFTDRGVTNAIGMDWDEEGNLYVSSYRTDNVVRFDTNGMYMDEFIGSQLSGPTNIWFDEEGDLLVLDYDGGAAKRFAADGTYQGVFIPGMFNPEGIAYNEDGNLLIGNVGSRTVRMYDSDGEYLRDFFPVGTLNLLAPNAVVVRGAPLNSGDPVRHTTFVYPSVGTQFFLKHEQNGEFDVYSSSGKLVRHGNIDGDLLWDAGQVARGTYLILLTRNDGQKYVQRVIVSK